MRDELDILLDELEESVKEQEARLKVKETEESGTEQKENEAKSIDFASIIKDLEERRNRFHNEFINPARERLQNIQKELDDTEKLINAGWGMLYDYK